MVGGNPETGTKFKFLHNGNSRDLAPTITEEIM
jgi:hypothetical protein